MLGVVDGADLTVWSSSFGVDSGADADLDGDSDGADFLVWQQQFGSSAPAVFASATVPEPGTLMLSIAAATAIRRLGGRMRQELSTP